MTEETLHVSVAKRVKIHDSTPGYVSLGDLALFLFHADDKHLGGWTVR